jgi:RNA polymerase sigma factor (sigma-70 family)
MTNPLEQRSDTLASDARATALDQRFRRPLMSFFLRRVRTHAEAEDLTQEVFVRLLRPDIAVREDTAHAYVFQIAANLLRDRARRDYVRQGAALARAPLRDDAGNPDEMPAAEDPAPDRVLSARQDLRAALDALDELSERTRDAFLLFRVEGMKQKEIATIFGISVSAVEKHIVKAAAHLARRREAT